MGAIFSRKGYQVVKVSIICLIYKSTQLADWVAESLLKYTPMLQTGEAEFFFVANDPSNNVIQHLLNKQYPFIINHNKVLSEEELFAQGYGVPEYMNRVYKGYNQGILHAKGERIVLINSDNYFSPDWLENLMKFSDIKKIISSKLVEPGHEKFHVFPAAIHKNFGRTVETFDESNFINFAMSTKKTGIEKGGAYMPCILYKEIAYYAGLYPEGNIADGHFDIIARYGDEFFYDKLEKMGVLHYTSLDSIVYHLKEGERDDASEIGTGHLNIEAINHLICQEYKRLPVEDYEQLNVLLVPSCTYVPIFEALLSNTDKIPPVENKYIPSTKGKILLFLIKLIPHKKTRKNLRKTIRK